MSEESKINPEEILNFLGMPDVKSVDELKEKFSTEFFRKSAPPEDLISSINGRTLSKVSKNIREIGQKYGLEISHKDIENKNIEDIVSSIVDGVKGTLESKVIDLEKQITEPNEALKDWEKKYSKLESKFKETENLLNVTANEYNGFKDQASSQLKSFKVNVGKKDLFSKLQFKSDMTELEKIGFDKYISDNYNLDLDENEDFIITDKKGQRLPSDKVVGTFKKPEDILNEKAIELNLVATNQHAKNNNTQPQQPRTTQPVQQEGRKIPTRPFGM